MWQRLKSVLSDRSGYVSIRFVCVCVCVCVHVRERIKVYEKKREDECLMGFSGCVTWYMISFMIKDLPTLWTNYKTQWDFAQVTCLQRHNYWAYLNNLVDLTLHVKHTYITFDINKQFYHRKSPAVICTLDDIKHPFTKSRKPVFV